ncbi:MAG: ribosome small subunit-dependent GTPase A [Candidatus Hydrogenedentes bacterium]|nr:ribosome small subunit-dependent GTPase A [Candidatus Hydrogenedentota bacterium]
MNLTELGWNPFFQHHFEPLKVQDLTPARVVRQDRHSYVVQFDGAACPAEISGKLHHDAEPDGAFPAVGDWVAVKRAPGEDKATIHAVLPRKSAFSRKAAGARTQEQVVAANIDTVFLVSGLDGDFNPSRIERYLTVAWNSGATPVIVLNKADLCADVEARIGEVEAVAFGVPVLAVSATAHDGLDALRPYLAPGMTAAFLGSSGVGKSTIINALLGHERQEVGGVREDDSRGRHTTTHRELIVLPGGGVVVDTPGMRELQLWADDDGLKGAFSDIEELAAECRFRDCAHGSEPGCAVRAAIESGRLDARRYESYLKLKRELRHAASRQDQKLRLAEKAKWKKIAVTVRRITRERGR